MTPTRALDKATAVQQGFLDVMGATITRGELLFLLCVAEHETHCGDDWKDNSGNPLHNWGAVQWRTPTADEKTRIDNGDLKPGDTIPGGVLQQDSSPVSGKYYVWFRTFPSDRQGAAFLVGTLYKHNPEARAVAIAGGSSFDFCKRMYLRGYFEGFRKGPPAPRPPFTATGAINRTDPLLPSEAANVQDYAGSVDTLMTAWVTVLAPLLPLVAQEPSGPVDADPAAGASDPGSDAPGPGHEAGESGA